MFWTVVKRIREIERSAKTPYLFVFSNFHIFVFYTVNHALDIYSGYTITHIHSKFTFTSILYTILL